MDSQPQILTSNPHARQLEGHRHGLYSRCATLAWRRKPQILENHLSTLLTQGPWKLLSPGAWNSSSSSAKQLVVGRWGPAVPMWLAGGGQQFQCGWQVGASSSRCSGERYATTQRTVLKRFALLRREKGLQLVQSFLLPCLMLPRMGAANHVKSIAARTAKD